MRSRVTIKFDPESYWDLDVEKGEISFIGEVEELTQNICQCEEGLYDLDDSDYCDEPVGPLPVADPDVSSIDESKLDKEVTPELERVRVRKYNKENSQFTRLANMASKEIE